MWTYPETFDVIVVGAGHAGCEASYVAAKMGAKTLLLTMNLDTIGKLSCNPAVGGTAKGHIVKEIDALGGIMGKIADRCSIGFRMLNASKGPAVHSPRAQVDKSAYQHEMKAALEETENLHIFMGTIESLIIEDGVVKGVNTKEGTQFLTKTLIISSGTFMRGLIHLGNNNFKAGRAGDAPSIGLSKDLAELGFTLGRLKTGTPPRIHYDSINFSAMEIQIPDKGITFSFDEPEPRLEDDPCYITYTNETTHQIIEKNKHRSPIFNGAITSSGPRYCPSIEDKIHRFRDKSRHQIFLEREGLKTKEVYVNGISTSLPLDVQHEMVRSIEGLEKAQIMRAGYAIEYDFITSGQIDKTLETKKISGLYFAGQINGTTGYEEAAAQGLIAGVNAVLKVQGKSPFILSRKDAYIGVMIDDLTTKEITEPYRMFTSRAEYRLILRQENADMRLREKGYKLGLIDEKRWAQFEHKKALIEQCQKVMSQTFVPFNDRSTSLKQLLKRPEMTLGRLITDFPDAGLEAFSEFASHIETQVKYEGYIQREQALIDKLKTLEEVVIDKDFDYHKYPALRKEAIEKLSFFKPHSLGHALGISGVSPADIAILMVCLKK